MRKLVLVGLVAALMAPASLDAAPLTPMPEQPEGCEAVNPGQPTCSYTATDDTASPVSGAGGRGSWVVTVKRGKKKFTYKSPPSGEPTAIAFEILAGDKITAKALTPGTGLVVGGE